MRRQIRQLTKAACCAQAAVKVSGILPWSGEQILFATKTTDCAVAPFAVFCLQQAPPDWHLFFFSFRVCDFDSEAAKEAGFGQASS